MDLQKGAGAKSGRTTTFSNLSGHVAHVRASTQCPVFGTVYKEYTRKVVQPLGENRDETTIHTPGDLPGIPLTDELLELLKLAQSRS